jgi:stearoyl-CoA desaturase (delta-9 desaturase)
MTIAVFFLGHWFLSLFAQTFFLHRYAAHGMFKMSRFWERCFFVFTYVVQGSSFLNPRAYAVMHRMHHAFSDTEKDPHSPNFFKDVFHFMMHTKKVYMDLLTGRTNPEPRFTGNYPVWERVEAFGDLWSPRVVWGLFYALFYWQFATAWWMFLLVPVHCLMGPIHGAIVNWCGHKYGYVNYDTRDKSRNTLNLDFLLMGELFQNNHHKFPSRPNFAVKWFEVDPTYPLMLLLHSLRIIKIKERPSSAQ